MNPQVQAILQLLMQTRGQQAGSPLEQLLQQILMGSGPTDLGIAAQLQPGAGGPPPMPGGAPPMGMPPGGAPPGGVALPQGGVPQMQMPPGPGPGQMPPGA